MKVGGGRCDLEQVLKYAVLLNRYPHKQSEAGKKVLLLMGPRDFPRLWKGRKYVDPTALKADLATVTSNEFAKKLERYDITLPEAVSWATSMTVRFISYAKLHVALRATLESLSGATQGDEVYRKLLQGMLSELESWEYATSPNT
jgi:hypothetical protein